MIGTVIKNSNGKDYKVLAMQGSYTILEDLKNGEYIVAWNLHPYNEMWTWGQGHYFTGYDGALEFFRKKVL